MKYLYFTYVLMSLLIISCNHIERKKQLNGKDVSSVKEYSKELIYDTVYYYYKGKRIFEYQNNLVSLLSYLKENDSIQIREMSFYNKNNWKAYVWSVQKNDKWIIIDNVFFDKTIQF